MTKRILSLALIVVMALALVSVAHASTIMYVSPSKGTTVNLRSTPAVTKNNLITQIPYGTPLTVKYVANGWAVIDYGIGAYDEAYMMVKYLSNQYIAPSPANTKKNPTNPDTTAAKNDEMSQQYKAMNDQFKSFHLVARPFTVYGKPARASGWSNLRFAPNEKSSLIRQVRMNEPLTVIGETARWYQVTDPVTGITGYISRQYVSTNQN